MKGDDLLKEIARSTGLPENLVQLELKRILDKAGKPSGEVSVDDLRIVLVDYLQDILLKAKKTSFS